jgi:hypothetical protein
MDHIFLREAKADPASNSKALLNGSASQKTNLVTLRRRLG